MSVETYEGCVELHGAHVLGSWREDDYSGEFWILCRTAGGETWFLEGAFGSCSGCDWLESALGEAEPRRTAELETIGRSLLNDHFSAAQAAHRTFRDGARAWILDMARQHGLATGVELLLMEACVRGDKGSISVLGDHLSSRGEWN